jgi:hypothetical protein
MERIRKYRRISGAAVTSRAIKPNAATVQIVLAIPHTSKDRCLHVYVAEDPTDLPGRERILSTSIVKDPPTGADREELYSLLLGCETSGLRCRAI